MLWCAHKRRQRAHPTEGSGDARRQRRAHPAEASGGHHITVLAHFVFFYSVKHRGCITMLKHFSAKAAMMGCAPSLDVER